ncbi:hypothetical protein LMH73_026175 [Vibrio splendidus]|nr:hypothetical protein [Vibrio splendidus]MCC4880478.1 hypothetical protein [Vibrio splendidus]
MKSDIKSEVDKEKIFIAPFSPKTLASDPELFKSLLMEHGRVPYQLDNNAVITVCRPLLCFENKTNDFKTTRFLVEQGFWKKKLSDESLGDDWKILSRVVLELF